MYSEWYKNTIWDKLVNWISSLFFNYIYCKSLYGLLRRKVLFLLKNHLWKNSFAIHNTALWQTMTFSGLTESVFSLIISHELIFWELCVESFDLEHYAKYTDTQIRIRHLKKLEGQQDRPDAIAIKIVWVINAVRLSVQVVNRQIVAI